MVFLEGFYLMMLCLDIFFSLICIMVSDLVLLWDFCLCLCGRVEGFSYSPTHRWPWSQVLVNAVIFVSLFRCLEDSGEKAIEKVESFL